MSRSRRFRAVLAVLLVGLVRCGGDSPILVVVPVATTIQLSPAELNFRALGETLQVTARVLDQVGDVMVTPVVWTSSADSVATVDTQGRVTSRAVGPAFIRANAGHATARIAVLSAQAATTVAVFPQSLELGGPGSEAALTVSAFDAEGSEIPDATVTMTSLAPAVATVSPDGMVTAVGVGSTTVVVVASSDESTVQAEVAVTVFGALTVDPVTIPSGQVGSAYEVVFSATGGDGVYVWRLIGGSLPPGLGLSADGTLNGVPAQAGSFDLNVQVTSGDGQTAQQALSIVVAEVLAVTTTTLPAGVEGAAYGAQTLVATGGEGTSYAWSVVSGALPGGMTLAATGEVAGTPTVPGTAVFTVEVSSGGQTAQQALTIVVAGALAVTTVALPDGVEGIAYGAQSLEATGADGTNYAWSVVSGALPAGLTLSASGEISGTPTVPGSANFTVEVASGGQAVRQALTIAVAGTLSVTTTRLPGGVEGASYGPQTLAATGGDDTSYAWSAVSGALPTGLSLATNGEITGTPTVPGTAVFAVEVSSGGQTAQQALSIAVAGALGVTTSALPDGVEGVAYGAQSLEAIGGDGANYAWSVLSGALPTGLTLSATGEVAGTPTAAGTANFTVEVSSGGQTAQQALSIAVAGALSVTTTALPAGVEGAAYGAQTLAATGGDDTNYAWSVVSGALPAGLTLSASGEISGTPTVPGTAVFAVEVSSGGQTAQQALSIAVAGALGVTTSALPDGVEGVAYGAQSLEAIGGDGANYAWSVLSGALPTGLTLSATGEVAGTPTAAGTAVFTVEVSSGGQTAQQALSVVVAGALVVTTTALPDGVEGVDWGSQTLAATGGDGANYAWSVVSGALPTGLTLSATGEVAGTPTLEGTANFTVEVVSGGQTAQQALSVVVAGALVVTTTTLPDGVEGVDWGRQTLAATGGDGTSYAWSVVSGALPTGLSLATNGEITGTPTVPGTAAFTVEVASGGQAAQQALTMAVAGTLSVTTTTLPSGIEGTPYGSQTLAATEGDGTSYAWSVVSGALPTGLSLATNGEITGTPTLLGAANFTVEVVSGGQTAQQALSIDIAGVLSVTTTTLSDGVEGVAYGAQSLEATGGDGTNYAWSVVSGALPAGLALAATGDVTGTPTAAGAANFTVGVASGGQTAQQALDIVIGAALSVTTTTLPDGIQGVDYGTGLLTATGADSINHVWSLAAGALPDGLSLAGTGEITGTPTGTGTSSFTVEVASGTQTAQQPLSILVTCQLQSLPDTDADGLPNCAETDTGIFVSSLDTGTDPFSSDTDDDGLGDGEEVLGTSLGLDLPAFGVNPLRMDLLLEYDWFEDAISCGIHSHRPTAAIEARVTASFAAAPVLNPDGTTGINFIHDYGQGGVLSGGNLLLDADGVLLSGVSGSEFLAYKGANFASNREGYFHYVVMPHRYNTSSSSSGQAEVLGDDMIVSLQCSRSTNSVSNTIVHELGHNLGLRHGGFENENNKPNYNSVMNYDYQFPGVDDDCTPPGDGVLDYSSGTRPPLNENNLQEPDGVCGRVAGEAWDWNGDGDAFDLNIVVDINGDGAFTTLSDFNDWAAINLSAAADSDGARLFLTPEIVSCFDPTVGSDGS